MDEIEKIPKSNFWIGFRKFFFVAFLFLLLFFPSFTLPGLSFKIQPIDCVIPLMLGWLIWKKYLSFSLIYIRNLLIFICIILASFLLNFKQNAINDLFEIYDVLKYVVVFLVFKEIYQPKIKQLTFDIAFILLIIINIFHYQNILGFNEHIMPLYCGENSIHLLTFGYNSIGEPATRRMLGLIGNPNNNAILFMIFLIQYLPKKGWKTKEMLFFYMAALAVAACQSRTGFIIFAFIFILNFFIIRWKWWKTTMHISILSLLLLLFFNFESVATYFHLDFLIQKKDKSDYIASLFNQEAFQSHSWTQRLEIWEDLLKESAQKPIIGHGPQKNHFYDAHLYAENEYVLMVWRYGLIGLLVYLLIYLIPIKNMLQLARGNLEAKNGVFIILIFMIASLTNVPLSHTILSPLFFMMMGIYYACHHEQTDLVWLHNLKKRWLNKNLKK